MTILIHLGCLSDVACVRGVSTLIILHSLVTPRGTSGGMLEVTSSSCTYLFVPFSVSIGLVVSVVSILRGDGTLSSGVAGLFSFIIPDSTSCGDSSSFYRFSGELTKGVCILSRTRVLSQLLGVPQLERGLVS